MVLNPLFTGFVSFILQDLPDYELETFQTHMLKRLTAIRKSETPQILEWYADLESHWKVHLDDEEIEEDYTAFMALITAVEPEVLLTLATIVRRDLTAEQVPDLAYSIKTFSATYTFEWDDGHRLEYNCKPVVLKEKLRLQTPMLMDLAVVFDRQISEVIISPGLDALYDQSARPYETAKYDELMNVLQQHIAQKSGSARDPYIDILARIMHQFGPAPKLELVSDEASEVEWLNHGGGF
jgi:hypothetical protein